MKTIFLFLMLPFLFGITHKSENIDDIEGYWISPHVESNVIIYKKAKNWKKLSRSESDRGVDGSGFRFLAEGVLEVRQNAGGCGTPPISYDVFDGTWSLDGKQLIIKYAFWGGQIKTTYEIVSVSKSTLKITLIDQQVIENSLVR